MKNLGIMLAAIMPQNMLIEKIEEAIKEHKLLGTEHTKHMLAGACGLFLTKVQMENTPGGMEGLIKEFDILERGKNMLTPGQS